MLLLFLLMTVIVTVHELGVVVLVSVPMGSMLPLTEGTAAVVMGDVVMVVGVQLRRMRVLGLFAFALGTLHSRHLLGLGSGFLFGTHANHPVE
jgi:hypothetical protein